VRLIVELDKEQRIISSFGYEAGQRRDFISAFSLLRPAPGTDLPGACPNCQADAKGDAPRRIMMSVRWRNQPGSTTWRMWA